MFYVRSAAFQFNLTLAKGMILLNGLVTVLAPEAKAFHYVGSMYSYATFGQMGRANNKCSWTHAMDSRCNMYTWNSASVLSHLILHPELEFVHPTAHSRPSLKRACADADPDFYAHMLRHLTWNLVLGVQVMPEVVLQYSTYGGTQGCCMLI